MMTSHEENHRHAHPPSVPRPGGFRPRRLRRRQRQDLLRLQRRRPRPPSAIRTSIPTPPTAGQRNLAAPRLNRWGTIVRPSDPATDWTRPDYEAAPWAIRRQTFPLRRAPRHVLSGRPPGQPAMERVELANATLYRGDAREMLAGLTGTARRRRDRSRMAELPRRPPRRQRRSLRALAMRPWPCCLPFGG